MFLNLDISDLCLFDYHWHILYLISKLYAFYKSYFPYGGQNSITAMQE